MICFVVAWYLTSLWVIWRFTDDRSELIAAAIAVTLGPFVFPVVFVGRIALAEKRKWEISNWYRDNWPPREYEILTGETAS